MRNEIFCKVNEKGEKNSQKNSKGLAEKPYPVGMEAITSRKTRNYKEKTKSIFDTEKTKKSEQWGEEILVATDE